MPHHFNKATVEASAYCPTCGKHTMHHVADGRLGRCVNDHHPAKVTVDEKVVVQENLFEKS